MENTTAIYNDFSSLSRLKLEARQSPDEAAKAVARQFESLFVSMMMKSMRDTLPKDGLFSSSQMDTYQQMYDQQLSLSLSEKGGIGLAKLIEAQIAKNMALGGDAVEQTAVDKGGVE